MAAPERGGPASPSTRVAGGEGRSGDGHVRSLAGLGGGGRTERTAEAAAYVSISLLGGPAATAAAHLAGRALT